MIDETLKIKTYVHPVDIYEDDQYVLNYLGLGRVLIAFIDDYEKIIYEYLNIMKEKKLIIDSNKRIINDRLIYDQCAIPISKDLRLLKCSNIFKNIELYIKFVEPNRIVNCLREDLNIKDKISYSKYRDEQKKFIIDFKRLSKLVKGEKLDDT